MEASGHARWLERLFGELQFELWMAMRRRARVRKQKTDRQDAQLILQLLVEDRFPRIWVPGSENRDLRQLLWHRHRMVQARTRVMNQLQAVALNEGLRSKKRLWRERERQQLESFQLGPWANRRRHDLLHLLDELNPIILELTQAVEREAEKYPQARRLRTHPGVGALTALAFVLILGDVERFYCGKQVASYLGLVPIREVQWKPQTHRPHHQTRKLHTAFPSSRGCAGDSTQRARVAQKILSPDATAWAKHCQSRDGTTAGGSLVLDVASRMELRAVAEVRFARGRARKSLWCAVEHRDIDWASCSLHRESELVIMIAV